VEHFRARQQRPYPEPAQSARQSKALFWAGAAREANAEAWLEQAAKHAGSWWPHWLEWIKARSGELVDTPAALGHEVHPPLGAAPGTYVMEK
jgi:polyhydroxyalkanoate synthase subunit PhaC